MDALIAAAHRGKFEVLLVWSLDPPEHGRALQTVQTLYDQIEARVRVLWPAYDRLGAELLDEPVIFVDETPWPLLGKNASSANWHAWTIATPKGAYYDIHDTRGLDVGKSLLGGFKGIAVTDGYCVYDALDGPSWVRSPD